MSELAHHDIRFKREGSTVVMYVVTDLPFDEKFHSTYLFRHECDSMEEAELLLRYLRERHDQTVAEIRRAEFESGWKHAKAKKHGLSYFDYFRTNLLPGATHG